jgi:hypothetical protein
MVGAFFGHQLQHKRLISLHRSIGTILLILCGMLTSCHAAPTTDDTYVEDLLQKMQACCGLVIGENYQGHLEYLDVLSDYAFHSVPLSPDMFHETTSLDLTRKGQNSFVSSDSEWRAKCSGNHCDVSSQTSPHGAIWISKERILTPLFWSPDNKFVFFIVKGPTWRTPARCSMEDERDIVLVELASGKQGVLKTVCGGFPYELLRWFSLPRTH